MRENLWIAVDERRRLEPAGPAMEAKHPAPSPGPAGPHPRAVIDPGDAEVPRLHRVVTRSHEAYILDEQVQRGPIGHGVAPIP
jgi:hypothetical protein